MSIFLKLSLVSAQNVSTGKASNQFIIHGGSGAKGGGIAFVIKDFLKPYVATTSSFPIQHPCFETAQLTLTYNKQLTNLFCIYHPPPNKKNKFSDSMFFDQFSNFLEHSDSLPGKTLLMGDFNFHFENVENNNSRKLQDIIDMFNLTQSISEPTHNQGHLLDLVFSKPAQWYTTLISTKTHHGLTSDHTAILCKLDVSVPVQKPETFSYRCLKKIDTGAFKQYLSHAVYQWL